MTTAATATRSPARTSWWPDLIFATAAVSVLVVVALWVHGRGLQDLAGPAAGFTSIGRLTGLVSADLLLLQVLLMARLPPVERAYGRDALTRWHRWLGFTSFDLMLAHVVLITIGYALTSHSNVVGEFWSLLTTYPGMLLALAATVALCLVAFTSVRLARRRLRYESWHLPRCRPGHPARAVDRGAVPRLRLGHRLLVDALHRGGRRHPGLPGRPAAVAQRAVPAAGRAGGTGGAGGVVGVADRAGTAAAAGTGRPVLQLALPHRPGLVAGAPVLAVGGARRWPAADHGEGGR